MRSLGLVLAFAASVTFPPFTGPVVDASDVVPAVVEQRVDASLLDFQQRTGIQVAVAVVESTAPETPDAYAADLARDWGVVANGLQRSAVLVVATRDHRAAVVVSPGLLATFPKAAQQEYLRTIVTPRVARDDVSDAVEVGAQELRRGLGDTNVPPPPSTVPPPRQRSSHTVPWGGIVFVLLAVALVVASRVFVRRRREWAAAAPVLWGSGWGRHVARPADLLDRRYRRVRDAVHVAEADTGLRLCFWLGPVEGETTALADDLFAHALHEGHAAVLLLVETSGAAVELRVADWAAARVTADVARDVVGAPPADALVVAATRIAAAAGAGTPGSGGGVVNPDLY